MSINAKITTYICFFTIVILFLYLGYSSVCSIEPAKVDPETLFLSKVIKCSKKIDNLAEELYNTLLILKKSKLGKVVVITDDNGNTEEILQIDIIYNKIDKIFRFSKHQKKKLEKLEEEEFFDTYDRSIGYYNKAADIVINLSDDIINDYDYEDYETILKENQQNYLDKLGINSSKVKYFIKRGNKFLKKHK